jgi:ribosome production factor 2
MAPTEQQRKASRTKELSGSKKVPNARVQRYLKSTESKLKEDGKNTLLLKGIKASEAMSRVLQELRALQAPRVKLLNKKNQIVPFEDQQSLEFLSTKNDCALFAVASHNKKRPNNLVIGRTFDHQVLDMAELGILRFKSSLRDYGGQVFKKRIGTKPLLMFQGDLWQQYSTIDYPNLQNLLTDFYRGQVVDKILATGIDHIIVFTIAPAQGTVLIHQRTYHIQLKKNPTDLSSKVPVPLLQPCGPDFDFVLRRTMWADSDLAKAARRQPAELRKKKTEKNKNKTTTIFGETMGRLHLEKQNVEKMGGRKNKALRRAEKAAADQESTAVESELDREKEEMGREFQREFGFAAPN